MSGLDEALRERGFDVGERKPLEQPPKVPRGFIRVDLAGEESGAALTRAARIAWISQEKSGCRIEFDGGGWSNVSQSLEELQRRMVEAEA